MVKKHIQRKRRSPMLISKAVLEKRLKLLKLEEMALRDLKKLEEMGFIASKTAYLKNNTSSNKTLVRRRLMNEIRKNPNNELLKNAQLKRVQHPNKNIKTYIIVTKVNGRKG